MNDNASLPAADRDIESWFRALERCVRAVDYAAGRELFAPDVIAFGTKADVVSGLDNVQASQWSGVWPTIRDFTFDLSQLRSGWSDEFGWAVVTWTSTGFDPNGEPFPRPGRATLLFKRVEGRLLAIHSHFSLAPGTPQRSYGARS